MRDPSTSNTRDCFRSNLRCGSLILSFLLLGCDKGVSLFGFSSDDLLCALRVFAYLLDVCKFLLSTPSLQCSLSPGHAEAAPSLLSRAFFQAFPISSTLLLFPSQVGSERCLEGDSFTIVVLTVIVHFINSLFCFFRIAVRHSVLVAFVGCTGLFFRALPSFRLSPSCFLIERVSSPGRLLVLYWGILGLVSFFGCCQTLSPGRLLGLYWAIFGHSLLTCR